MADHDDARNPSSNLADLFLSVPLDASDAGPEGEAGATKAPARPVPAPPPDEPPDLVFDPPARDPADEPPRRSGPGAAAKPRAPRPMRPAPPHFEAPTMDLADPRVYEIPPSPELPAERLARVWVRVFVFGGLGLLAALSVFGLLRGQGRASLVDEVNREEAAAVAQGAALEGAAPTPGDAGPAAPPEDDGPPELPTGDGTGPARDDGEPPRLPTSSTPQPAASSDDAPSASTDDGEPTNEAGARAATPPRTEPPPDQGDEDAPLLRVRVHGIPPNATATFDGRPVVDSAFEAPMGHRGVLVIRVPGREPVRVPVTCSVDMTELNVRPALEARRP